MGFEHAEKLRSGYARDPTLIKRIEYVIPYCFSSDMIDAIGVRTLKQKKHPTKTSLAQQMSSRVRSIIHIFLFHSVNDIGILPENIL